MHEGLSHDDIYIMVEDEFQAVARSFTQHLHHAEYVRMKNRAKDKNASAISTISRPTDSITTMRAETRKKKEAEAKAIKQRKALDQIKAQAGRPRTDSEDESEPEVANDSDLWAGTTLQGLMTSPSRNQTSLTGIEGVRSTTRAAAGYSKAEVRSSQGARAYDVASFKAGTMMEKSSVPPDPVNDRDDATTSEDDDDLDAPVIRKKHPPTNSSRASTQNIMQEYNSRPITKKPPPNSERPTTTNIPLSTLSEPSALRNTNLHPLPKLSTKSDPALVQPFRKSILKSPKPLHDLEFYDGLPRPTPLQETFAKRKMRRLANLNVKRAEEEQDGKGRRTSVSEIPIFLV